MSEATPVPIEMEPRVNDYLRRLHQIDELLDGPVRTLVRLAHEARLRESDGIPRFPLWLSPREQIPSPDSALTTGMCVATLQRLTKVRRSFPWLGAVLKEERERAERIEAARQAGGGKAPVPEPAPASGLAGAAASSNGGMSRDENDSLLEDQYLPELGEQSAEAFFVECCRRLESETFGFLNPLTAAQVFRVLMQRGEESAHAGMGCLAFFAMVWPLHRPPRTPFDFGVRIEPSDASAYATNKCVLPLLELQELCSRRAQVFSAVAENVERMQKAAIAIKDAGEASLRSTYDEWTFYAELDELRRNLLDLSHLSIAGRGFKQAEAEIGKPPVGAARNGTGPPDVSGIFGDVTSSLARALEKVETTSVRLHREAVTITKQIEKWIIPVLGGHRPDAAAIEQAASSPTDGNGATGAAGNLEARLRVDDPGSGARYEQEFGFACGHQERPVSYGDYLAGLKEGATLAIGLCKEVLGELEKAKTLGATAAEPASIAKALHSLSAITQAVARKLQKPISKQAEWCQVVVNREVANASADNFTEFDPSELVAALLVSVRANRLTQPQAADAVKKALLGVQEDGAWRISHPYFSADGDRGILPPAADLVWTLVAVIERFPTIDVADRHLFWFMDWLARTQVTLILEPPDRAAGTDDAGAVVCATGEHRVDADAEPGQRVGWPADRARRSGPRVHLLTTAFAVNALLALRELIEHRLWEICERRFTIIPTGRSLKATDPVDLSLPHKHRLHSRLAELMRGTVGGGGRRMYSMVLHGPPGSSKTTVASSLAHDHWRQTRRWGNPEARLVRITPADFTGSGEDRIDSEAKLIFRLLGNLRGVTILFDEIDDLLRRRTAERPIFLDLVIPAMLNRLQDLRDACEKQDICFLFGTNYVERIEPALMRPGRIDEKLPVVYADFLSRTFMAEKAMHKMHDVHPPVPAGRWKEFVIRCARVVAENTGGWTWNALRDACESVSKHVPADENQPPEAWSAPQSWILPLLKPLWRAADLDGDYRERVQGSPELSMEYVRYLICRRSDPLNHATAEVEKHLLQAEPKIREGVIDAFKQFNEAVSA